MLTVACEQALKQAKLAARERASKQRRREMQRKGKLSLLPPPPPPPSHSRFPSRAALA